MKTDAEYDAELRFKRGDRFVVEIHVFEFGSPSEDSGLLDTLYPGDVVEIVGYDALGWPRRGIGYVVQSNGMRYVRPLPRKCIERYMRPVEEGE